MTEGMIGTPGVCLSLNTHARMYARTHTHTHTHTRIYTHIYLKLDVEICDGYTVLNLLKCLQPFFSRRGDVGLMTQRSIIIRCLWILYLIILLRMLNNLPG